MLTNDQEQKQEYQTFYDRKVLWKHCGKTFTLISTEKKRNKKILQYRIKGSHKRAHMDWNIIVQRIKSEYMHVYKRAVTIQINVDKKDEYF